MAMDRNTVAHVAQLARLRVPERELESLSGELGGILDWIEQLRDVETEGVQPLAAVVESELYRRHDGVDDGDIRDDVLANAPETQQGYFVVPKVVE